MLFRSVDDLKSTRGVAQLLDNIDAPGSVVTARRSLGKISSDLADNIKKEIGVHCLRVEKIHEANGMVYGYAKIYLPSQYEEVFTVENLEKYTVYDIYREKAGVKLGKGTQKIYATNVTKEISKIMKIPSNAPIMCIERWAYSKEGRLLEYMQLYCEASQYCAHVELDLSIN